MVEKVPLGYRFRPTDEELVGHYLKHKLLGDNSMIHNIIAEVDVCKVEPWDLPAFSKVKSDDPEWFFFSPLVMKFTKSTRCNRKTEAGYWKITGKDRTIKARGTNNVIGTKKTLVFYKICGRVRVKTNWVIHEYHAVTFPDDKRRFVLCRLMEKAEKKAEKKSVTDVLIHDEGEPSSHVAADYENQATVDRTPYVHASPDVNLESIFPATPQEEEYGLPSLLQLPIDTDQAQYYQVSTFPDACFGNEKFPFETSEEEDGVDYSFLESILLDEDVFICQETSQTPPTFVNDSSASESLKEVHFGSSETDDEPLSALRRFVLCRSIEKAEKKSVTDALIHDEGEPSSHVAAADENQATAYRTPYVYTLPEVNLESIFLAPLQEEEYGFPLLPQLPIEIDQAPYFQVSTFPDTLFGNEKFPFETSEEEDGVDYSFLESILLDKDVFICQETSQTPPTSVNDSSASGSLREVHFGSSETDDEQLSALLDNILHTIPSVWNKHTDPRDDPALSMVESLHDAVYAGLPPLSSENEVKLENNNNTFNNDPTAEASFSVFLIQSVGSPPPRASSSSPSGNCQSNFVSLGAAEGKSQTQVSISSQEVPQQEALMETCMLESNLEQRNAQGTSPRKDVETTSNNLSPGVTGKGSFLHLETPFMQRFIEKYLGCSF